MQVGRRPGERRCGNCGEALSPSPAVLCQTLRCLALRAAAGESSRQERRDALAHEALVAAGVDPARGGWSLVPLNRSPQVPVPGTQREAFLAHLGRIAEESRAAVVVQREPAGDSQAAAVVQREPAGDSRVARAPAGKSRAPSEDPAGAAVAGSGTESRALDPSATGEDPGGLADPALTALLGQGCAACRGRCCRKGRARHAFLEASDLAGVVAGLEGTGGSAGTDEIVSLYASFIGDTHTEGSCVFHGPEGCRLPRGLRSRTCNTFYCSPLVRLRDVRLRDDATPAAHVFVPVSDELGVEPELGALRVVPPPHPGEA